MSTTANYASTPKVGAALLTTADTSLTAPTTVGTVFTAGASGSRIDFIEVMGVATTVASLINLFIYDGSTYHLWKQIPVQAVTTSTTTPSYAAAMSSSTMPLELPLVLPTGYSLRATTTVTQTGVKVIATGGDF